MRKLALFIILCLFTIFTDYSLTQTKEPAPIPTFYNGKWVVVDNIKHDCVHGLKLILDFLH